MTPDEKNRLLELIANPPAGSKLAAAKEYGVDLTLIAENLEMTLGERLKRASEAARFFKALHGAARRSRAEK